MEITKYWPILAILSWIYALFWSYFYRPKIMRWCTKNWQILGMIHISISDDIFTNKFAMPRDMQVKSLTLLAQYRSYSISYPYLFLHQVVHHIHRQQMIDAHFHPQSSKRCFSRIIISWRGDPSNHLLLRVTHPCLKIRAILTKSRGSRRIRLLFPTKKVTSSPSKILRVLN